MTNTRRDLLRNLLGGAASLEALSLLGCHSQHSPEPEVAQKMPAAGADTGFSVICHGMFLFEFANSQLTIHMTDVPSMGFDAGHVYYANTYNSFSGAVDLSAVKGAQFDLQGVRPKGAAVPPVPASITATDNILLLRTTDCPFALNGLNVRCKIVMPMPDDYYGWRRVSSQGCKLFTTDNKCITIPQCVYSSHVFHFTSPQSPALIDHDSLLQQWPPENQPPGSRLHLFAQPKSFCDLVAAGKKQKLMDHTAYLNQMFQTAIVLDPALDKYLQFFDDPTPPKFLLTPPELQSPDELTAARSCYSDGSVTDKRTRVVPFNVVAGKLINCRSYMVTGS